MCNSQINSTLIRDQSMAESAVFSLASKILSTIASPAFDKAYERGLSIWEARDELGKLRVTIETIQAMLLDAERKQEGSDTVKNLIKRLKGVLYDADDLFDEVATDDLLKQQMMEGNNKLSLKKKVRVSCSKLNPIVARDSIAKKVKAIRKSLGEISTDMAGMGFVSYSKEEEITNGMTKGQDPGCFVDAHDVIGRDAEKKALLEVLLNESDKAKPDFPVVIAIVGIGGMGKTTLAQLIYNDDEVKRNFEKRWFACISNISNEKEVLGKIFQSICEENYSGFTVSQLQTKIKESIEGKKFLLVLDNVWDENHGRWINRMKLLSGGAKGSKIIVTTRSFSVAKAVDALETGNLDGLTEVDSWVLFKRVAFAPGNENDPRRMELGREIVKKCANVPLAIRSIGSLLFEKNTIQEWELIRYEELPKLGQSHEDGIMPVLKLSYDHLQSNLKQCFAYCSLFPKDYEISKQELIYLWIAQGYIEQNNEDVGHSHFMYLLRRGFFQKARGNRLGEISSVEMHNLIHDLAQHVAGEESTMLTSTISNTRNCTRHVSDGGFLIDESRAIPAPLLNVKRLRSYLLLSGGSICSSTTLDQLFTNFKWLRALSLMSLGIKNVSSSIGELKHLRYLDLSCNKFESLPDSVTNLLNLRTLDIRVCEKLEALPDDLRKLINLRCLNITGCDSLKHMPAGIGEMTCLQYLSDFKVEEGVKKRSGLDALAGLQHQLRGELRIEFKHGIEEEDWDVDECSWQLPVSPQQLHVNCYPGIRIPHWANDPASSQLLNLGCIILDNCLKVKYLPPFRSLRYLKRLIINELGELEYMEEEEINEVAAGSVNVAALFFPSLEGLDLSKLPQLKGWSKKNHHAVAETSTIAMHQQLLSFPLLSELWIYKCEELKSMPPSPCIRKLDLLTACGEVIEQLLSPTSPNSTTPSSSSSSSSSLEFMSIIGCKGPISFPSIALTSLRRLNIENTDGLEILHLASPHLTVVSLWFCNGLTRVQVEVTSASLWSLSIHDCYQLENLHIAHPNVLEELVISQCPELELRGVDWDSLPNLRWLMLDPLPPLKELPECLVHRQALGNLRITEVPSLFKLHGVVMFPNW